MTKASDTFKANLRQIGKSNNRLAVMVQQAEPDYKELLKRYMKHVTAINGVTLLNTPSPEEHLSDRDLDELQKLDYED
jgi:acyl-CoA hydrolase